MKKILYIFLFILFFLFFIFIFDVQGVYITDVDGNSYDLPLPDDCPEIFVIFQNNSSKIISLAFAGNGYENDTNVIPTVDTSRTSDMFSFSLNSYSNRINVSCLDYEGGLTWVQGGTNYPDIALGRL